MVNYRINIDIEAVHRNNEWRQLQHYQYEAVALWRWVQ